MANKDFSPNTRPDQSQNNEGPKSTSKVNSNGQKAVNPGDSADEQLKKLLEQMADKDPAYIAEIIHQWLSEDKK